MSPSIMGIEWNLLEYYSNEGEETHSFSISFSFAPFSECQWVAALDNLHQILNILMYNVHYKYTFQKIYFSFVSIVYYKII